MSRKFIAGITAAAIAVSAFTASQAQADVRKRNIVLGAITLGLIGAALADDNNSNRHAVTRGYGYDPYGRMSREEARRQAWIEKKRREEARRQARIEERRREEARRRAWLEEKRREEARRERREHREEHRDWHQSHDRYENRSGYLEPRPLPDRVRRIYR